MAGSMITSSTPRAACHRVSTSIGGWISNYPEDVHDGLHGYQELGGEHNLAPRSAVRDLLAQTGDARTRTAIVQLWGGARGNNGPRSVRECARTSHRDPRPGADEHPTGLSEGHEFLWDPGTSWRTSDPKVPYVLFGKLWVPADRRGSLTPGVALAFGTKILYWAARSRLPFDAPIDGPIPLIYDRWVSHTLHDLGASWDDTSDQSDQRVFPRSDSGKPMPYLAYAAYCTLAHRWAQHLNDEHENPGPAILPDDIELWLFRAGMQQAKAAATSTPPSTPPTPAGGPDDEDHVSDEDVDPTHASEEPTDYLELCRKLNDCVGLIDPKLPSGPNGRLPDDCWYR